MNREFTISTVYKMLYGALALALTGGAIYIIAMPNRGSGILYAFPLLLVAAGAVILLSQFKRKIIITDGTITNIGLFKTSELAIADIKGYRIGAKGKTLYIEPATATPKLVINNYSDFDGSGDFTDWLKTNFKDLDDTDYQDELARILSDTALGATTQERQAQLDRAQYISWIYNGGGIALFLASVFFAGKETVIEPAMLLYPVLSLFVVVMGNGLIKIFDKKKSPYSHILVGLIAPMIAQIIAVGNNHILQFSNFWVPFAVLFLVLTAVFYYVDRVNNAIPINGQIFIVLLLGALYGFGSVVQLNRIYDQSPGRLYHATVLSEYVHHGKGTSYNLRLSPWGPEANQQTISVSSNMYYQTAVGSAITLHLHQGYFNIPWYTVSN